MSKLFAFVLALVLTVLLSLSVVLAQTGDETPEGAPSTGFGIVLK